MGTREKDARTKCPMRTLEKLHRASAMIQGLHRRQCFTGTQFIEIRKDERQNRYQRNLITEHKEG